MHCKKCLSPIEFFVGKRKQVLACGSSVPVAVSWIIKPYCP